MSEYVPRIFEDTHDWFKRINREFQFREPVDLVCKMTPEVVEAASGHTFMMTCVVGEDLVIPAGAHITFEVRESWDTHLGNCFRRGIRTVGNREQIKACYGAWTDVVCSNAEVVLAHEASYGRIMDLVDIVVVEGELQPGDEVRIILGPNDGCLLQAQKFAQVAIFPVAVDLKGDGEYRRAAVSPQVKVVGAFPDRFRIFAPGTVASNAEFDARVLPVDVYSFNPATGYRGTGLLASTPDLDFPKTVEMDTGIHPLGVNIRVKDRAERGVHYITAADPNTGLSGRSNPIGVDFVPEGNIYFGELHSQMWHSMGTGTTAEYFEWGRDVGGLDFCAPANHYNWRFEVTDEIWHELIDTCNAYNDPGNFATLVSYEWGGTGGSGHRNVYFRGDSGEFTFWYKKVHKDIQEFWDSLGDQDVLTAPHHLKAGCAIGRFGLIGFSGLLRSVRSGAFLKRVGLRVCNRHLLWGIALGWLGERIRIMGLPIRGVIT
ncbi:MAG: DUF3604 domain-containing protein [Candidatus Latescibacteria bacterium]|nr:DUF3604 domain-containing protein [Candidatus Latescibacterota bacterium]